MKLQTHVDDKIIFEDTAELKRSIQRNIEAHKDEMPKLVRVLKRAYAVIESYEKYSPIEYQKRLDHVIKTKDEEINRLKEELFYFTDANYIGHDYL